ncbi:MAG: transketolase, partial [Acidobacteria bacterium]|nr:transketolase [Acidobacteriota bacterium]
WGAPNKQDTHAAHGEPLGEEEIRLTKRNYGWPEDEKFLVPDEVRQHFKENIGARGKQARDEWFAKVEAYGKEYPELADQLVKMQKRELPDGWDKDIPVFPPDAKGMAGRDASGKVLNAIAKNVPWFIGGAADLAPSTKTRLTFEGAGDFTAENDQEKGRWYGGKNFHFGIREHGMSAILNGLSLSKIRPYGSGFMIFSDYSRPSIRLSAIMEIPTIHIFTHDSIGVGEDGPTHQPIEQLASMRAIPGLIVMRPGDANEVAEAWRVVMGLKHEPAVMIMSRQAMATLDRTKYASAEGVKRGAYVLADNSGDGGQPEVILMGTGTEVSLCVEAYEKLVADGVKARVVSMPSWEIFEHQDESYKNEVLPPSVKARVAVEQAGTFGWRRYVNSNDAIVAMKTFGASAPLKELTKKFGFTLENVVDTAKREIEKFRSEK